jgi:hypothetical protein
MNQELIKRLADGEIQLQNTGTVEQLREILAAAFPNDGTNSHGTFRFYERWSSNNPYNWRCNNKAYNLPIYTTEQFFEVEHTQVTESTYDPETQTLSETVEYVSDTKKKMDDETRELAKQLFRDYMNINLTKSFNTAHELTLYKEGLMEIAIEDAEQFIQLLNEHE